ncbi:prenyltransferase/squalene oxidase repeat-containing protein [Nocardioides sp.]|uniref:prenyltransferase/squalene oxidase repeat-containing protein n=1 Tax=Nocardioides sp. TaxID=35761 RepID=UPI003565A749
MRTSLRRAALWAATPALALSTLAVTAPTAGAYSEARVGALESAPVAGAAGWLSGQLTNGLLVNEQYTFTDVGLTVDAALGLDAVGDDESVAVVAGAVDDPDTLRGYIGDGEGEAYAGSTAKALLLAQVAEVDPTTFGGVDLVSRLESLVVAEGDAAGRIKDRSAWGDYANVIGQAYAVEGLDAAGSELTDPATDFLLRQQCAAGYFRLYLPAADAAQGTCDTAGAPASIDATAIAVRALLPQADDLDVAPRVATALNWLESQQAEDGSLGSGDGEVANTNSTGLAGWAFGLAGHDQAAADAADWVVERQAGTADACRPNALRHDLGAIAYDDAGRSAGEVDGITVEAQDQWRRASAQALPALQWLSSKQPMGDVRVDGPRRFSQGSYSLSVSGLAEGEQACLRGPGLRDLLVGEDSAAYEIKAPARTTRRNYTLTRLGAAPVTVGTTVLAARKLPITLQKQRVAAGKRQTVRIRGLEAGEKVTVRFRGQRVDRGHAGPAGRFVSTFRVLGDTGRAKIKVVGQFANRTNRKGFWVR